MGKFYFMVSGEMGLEAIEGLFPLDDGSRMIKAEYEPLHNRYLVLAENDDTGADDGQEIPYVIPVYVSDGIGNHKLIAWHEPTND